jgi:poly(A) polymerase Pap1
MGHDPAEEERESPMNQVSIFGRAVQSYAAARPVYAYRVSFAGTVGVTTDPVEVARIRRAYPTAQV